MPEETLTVVGGGNNSCNVSWGGGNGNNGGAGYSGKYGGTSYEGATSMLKLNDRVLIQLYLCNPLNPDYIGAPWGSDKDAESIIRANRDKPGKFKANIQNWKTSGTGSLGNPVVGKSYSSGDVDTYSVSFGKEKYNVLYNRKKDSFTTAYVDGGANKPEHSMKDQAIAVVKLYLLNESQASVIDTTSGIITDSGKTLSGKLGDKYNTLAREAADNIKNFQGKKLRSFNDAMASINELANNPKMKLSQADKTVVSNALKQMDLSALADRFKGLEKAFTWGDRLLKAEKIRDGVVTGVTTGDWQKLAFEVEAMYLSGVAGAVALGITTAFISAAAVALSLPSVAVTALTVVAVIGISILTSYIDAEKAKALNNAVLGLFK
ncbi:colicin-like pore-forming protein [Klebsiella pneumoniae]|uniref:colicin-like pore-forming protein n=1 Tax=Klebsiella pneumoniae TaxID=573 RepID=UPI000B9AB7E0|nr:colicin-like pore-forming protein [Klebsiella pneumoniae]